MATRKKTTAAAKEPEYKNEKCDNCELSKWVTHLHQHFDHAGKPICLTCPYKQFHILRGSQACANWKQKPKEATK